MGIRISETAQNIILLRIKCRSKFQANEVGLHYLYCKGQFYVLYGREFECSGLLSTLCLSMWPVCLGGWSPWAGEWMTNICFLQSRSSSFAPWNTMATGISFPADENDRSLATIAFVLQPNSGKVHSCTGEVLLSIWVVYQVAYESSWFPIISLDKERGSVFKLATAVSLKILKCSTFMSFKSHSMPYDLRNCNSVIKWIN
jgi:hypothetical protein